MNARTRRSLAITLGLAAVVVPLTTGFASADEDPTAGYPSTQSPLQGLNSGGATADTAVFGFNDAVNGDNRPDGANGVESEFPPADPRYVEGPLGGLLVNGPMG